MHRRGFIKSVFGAVALSLLSGCADKADPKDSPGDSSEASTSSDVEGGAPSKEGDAGEDRYAFTHGIFEVIDGWYKYDPHSTEAKPFFVPKDYDGTGIPDIISVKHGTNHYSKDDPTTFGRAITAQLARQVQGIATVEVTASGITSDMGDPVLVFDIPTKDCQITQYYICGDHEHILVYESNSVDQKSAMRSPRQS